MSNNFKWIGVKKFIELTGVSRSKVNQDIKSGILDFRHYGKKLMINYSKFCEDLDNYKLEITDNFENLSD